MVESFRQMKMGIQGGAGNFDPGITRFEMVLGGFDLGVLGKRLFNSLFKG
jgi:hypothetical protein